MSETHSDVGFGWHPPQSATVLHAANGLNQYTNVGGIAVAHDDNGNLTVDHRGRSYVYDAENVLRAVTGVASYRYYPDGTRAMKTIGNMVSSFFYMRDQEIAEYSQTTLLRRYVRLPGSVDEPVLMIADSDALRPLIPT